MSESRCPQCNEKADWQFDRLINKRPGVRALGSFFVLAKGVDQFNLLECPNCNCRWQEPRIRFLGIFPPEWYWLPLLGFCVAGVIFGLWAASAT